MKIRFTWKKEYDHGEYPSEEVEWVRNGFDNWMDVMEYVEANEDLYLTLIKLEVVE